MTNRPMTDYGANPSMIQGGMPVKSDRKVAFISDADNAFGHAIACKLADAGMTLVLNSPLSKSISKASAIDVLQAGTTVMRTCQGLNRPSEVEQIREQIAAAFGRLDLVVHTHNRIVRSTIEHCSEDTFDAIVEENVKTAFLCTQILGHYMVSAECGQIVYISSIHGEKPTGSSFLYAISKGAIKMLCHESALALGRHGIRVNVVEMGPVEGDEQRFESDVSDVYLDYQRKVPSAVLGTPEDLANVVAFLASDEAKYLNGAAIRMDGGFILHYLDSKMKHSM